MMRSTRIIGLALAVVWLATAIDSRLTAQQPADKNEQLVAAAREGKLKEVQGNLRRAAVELAKDWRMDRSLRHLQALMIVADTEVSILLSGTGDVIEPDDGVLTIGSGGPMALAAARALLQQTEFDAETIAREAVTIAAGIDIYTNDTLTVEVLSAAGDPES